jgi:HK97 family phage major capsid protein
MKKSKLFKFSLIGMIAILVSVFTLGSVDSGVVFDGINSIDVASLAAFAFAPSTKFVDYLMHLGKSESFETLEVKEQSSIYNQYIEGINKAIADKLQSSDAETTNVKSELKTAKEEVIRIATELKALQEQPKDFGKQEKLTMVDAIVKGFRTLLTDNNNLKGFSKGQFVDIEVNFANKAAGTMTTANVTPVGTDAIPFSLAEYELGLTRVQRRSPFILAISNTSTTTKGYVQWAEQANPDPGAAGSTEEGATKTQTDFDIVEKSAKVEKITAFIKVSKEMLDDIGYLENEIRTELVELVLLKADEQVLKGNGTSPQMKGIMEFATAFNGGGFVDKIKTPNNFDVLRAAINQVHLANFEPTYIVLNPTEVAEMELTKDADGRYIMPPFTTADATVIKGLRVISNTGVTAGSFLVGDFTKARVAIRENVVVQAGYENDDFTKNLVTFLAEMRGVTYVKSNHTTAFVKGTFAAAKALIELT